jgi:hypothetical protein
MNKLLLISLLFAQVINTGSHRKVFSGGGCSPPTMTGRWAAYNSANLCGLGGGSSCTTTGDVFYQETDFVASNSLTQTSTSHQPTYTTGAINSLPAVDFAGSPTEYLPSGSGFIVPTTGSFTLYAIFNADDFTVIKPLLSTTTAGGLLWGFYAGGELLNIAGGSAIGSSITTYSTGVWYTLVVTYNTSTGAYAFYNCSGGTCAADGSGTNVQTITQVSELVGGDFPDSSFFNGKMAEFSYLNSVSTAGIGAWSLCKYGI